MAEYQTFRLAGALPDSGLRIEVSMDEETGQKLVFWDDIEDQFPGIQSVKHGDIAVSFARDAKRKRIEPLCIVYRPGAVLDVILQGSPESSTSSLHSRTGSVYRSRSVSTAQDTTVFPVIQISTPLSHSHSQSASLTTQHYYHNHQQQQQQQQQQPLLQQHYHQYDSSAELLSSAIADISMASQLTPPEIHQTIEANTGAYTIQQQPLQELSHVTLLVSPPLSPASFPLVRSTSQLVPKIQSTLQTSAQLFGHFEQSIKQGQLHQAESIKQEIRTHFGDLQTEISKNKELQLQTLQLQQTAAEMQQRMLEMQQQALDRLAVIQSRVQALITTTYELHEYPIPRLFIVLPRTPGSSFSGNNGGVGSDSSSETWDRLNPWTRKFRLYFLCECGDHTKTPGSKIPHHIHLAKHEGYDVDRPTEFFEKYGSYLLIMMEMVRYGVATAGFVVPALASARILDGLDGISDGFAQFTRDAFGPLVQESIDFVQRQHLPDTAQAPMLNEDGATNDNGDMDLAGQVALEGADLRQLASFLKNKDEAKVLGNLYRIVTNEGHVKWVCLDHYRENYRETSVQQFQDAIAVNGGTFDPATGKVQIRLTSSAVARQFYETLEHAKFIQELSLVLNWETSLDDFRLLRDTILKTNVVSLKLDCCNATGPSRDILLNRTKRYDPIVQMMANPRLQAFCLVRCEAFWSRLTKLPSSSSSPSPSSPSSPSSASSSPAATSSSAGAAPSIAFQLRSLTIQSSMDHWKHDQHRLEEILRQCPRLTELKLQVADTDSAFELIRQVTSSFERLRVLNLSVIQSNQQEQVDIVLDDKGEISSVVISTNKRPYTQLAYCGKVTKMIIYHEFGMSEEGTQFHSVLEKNKGLRELGVRCPISGFVPLLNLVRQAIVGHGHTEFERLEIQDLAGWNKLVSVDLKDPIATKVELTSTESAGREEIFAALGWAIKVIPNRIQFTPALVSSLEQGSRHQIPILRRLYLDITKLNKDSLDLFVIVIGRCIHLEKLEVSVRWAGGSSGGSHSNSNSSSAMSAGNRIGGGSDLNTAPLARFISQIAPRITHLSLRASNLLNLMFDLASFMVTRYDGPIFVPGSTMPMLKELTLIPSLTEQTRQQQHQQPQKQQQQQQHRIKHCQLNAPQIRWLVIPLASPSLCQVHLGYLDILKDDWTATLHAINFQSLQHLTFKGTNLSDAQARLLVSTIPPSASLKSLTIEDSLVSKPCLQAVESTMQTTAPECTVTVK
ncbi:hypothetical protein BG004_006441 [Podila humilis]|nr:hypothetical protein BG004_006441 [Podila humilis]